MQPKATGNKNSDRPKVQSWRQMSMLGIIPTISPQWFGSETENVRPKGEKTLLNFHSRLQIAIENYAMTAFSIQPIRAYGQQTIFPHLRVAIAKFSISLRVLMDYACYYFGTKFEHAFKELNILILITDFDLKKVT